MDIRLEVQTDCVCVCPCEPASHSLGGSQGLLQELFNLVGVSADLLVVDEEGGLGARRQVLQHLRRPGGQGKQALKKISVTISSSSAEATVVSIALKSWCNFIDISARAWPWVSPLHVHSGEGEVGALQPEDHEEPLTEWTVPHTFPIITGLEGENRGREQYFSIKAVSQQFRFMAYHVDGSLSHWNDEQPDTHSSQQGMITKEGVFKLDKSLLSLHAPRITSGRGFPEFTLWLIRKPTKLDLRL